MKKMMIIISLFCTTYFVYAEESYGKSEKEFKMKTDEINKNLKEFWKWFQQNEKSLYDEFIKNNEDMKKQYALLNKIDKHLHKFSDGLYLEIENNEKSLNLIITPQGIRKYFADTFEAVKYAPKLTYWTIQATKHKTDLKKFLISKGSVKINNDELFFVPINDEKHPDKTFIKIIHPSYDEKSSNKGIFQESVYNIIDETLGEVSASFDIDYIEFSNHVSSSEKKLPLSKLEEYIQTIKANRKYYNQEFLPDLITLMEGKKDGKPLSLLVNLTYKHYSFKQKYPYLLTAIIKFNKTTNQGYPENLKIVQDIETEIIDSVIKDKNGHYIYSETYNGQRTFCMQCKDKKALVDEVKALKEKITSHKIEYIITFDPFWMEVERYLNY